MYLGERSPLAPSQVGPSALWRQGCSGGGGGELVENHESGELLFFDRLDFSTCVWRVEVWTGVGIAASQAGG